MEETKVSIKPKITRSSLRLSALDNLKEATNDTKNTSEKLKKLFEKNTYQKKTQLTVLRRYKRRLDAIEREEEARRKRAARKKIKVPQIKKFVGSFFAPGASNDPLKALGTLAAFNTATNLAQGKWFDAFTSGLTAAGLVAGPALLGMGINKMFNRDGSQIKRKPKVTGDGNKFKNPFRRNPKATGEPRKSGKIGRAFGRFGKSIIPVAGAALGAADAAIRATEGDVTGSAIAGTSAALDAYAAASAATGVGLPAAGILSVVSFGLDLVNLVRDLSGASEKEIEKNKKKKKDDKGKTIEDRLKEQTEKQKKAIESNRSEPEKGPLTFSKTLDSYEKVIKKFEEFSKNFKPSVEESLEETQKRATNVENLIGDQDIIEEPGYEFTNYTSQYLTGDPNSPAYDYSHGTSSNYHDHIAFNDRDTAIRAYQYLESKGLDVTEFQGFDPVGGHSRGSKHYSGLAFDVPGYQWGATGPIDQRHYNGSRRVRKYLNEFFQMEKNNNRNLKQKKTQEKTTSPTSPTPPTPKTSTTPISTKSNLSSVTINGFTYQKKDNIFYENGKPITKQLMDAVIKNHKEDFKDWKMSRNIEVDSDNAKVAIVMVPTPVPSQKQSPQIINGSSNFTMLNNDVNRVVANLSYNKTLLLS